MRKLVIISILTLVSLAILAQRVNFPPGQGGGSSGGGGTNYDWNSAQFTVVGSTQVNLKVGIIATNITEKGNLLVGTTNVAGALALKAPITSAALVTPDIGVATGTSLTMGGTNIIGSLAGKQDSIGYTPVNRAGDTMSGTLTVTGLTNSALTASRAIVSAADKSLASSATTDTELGYVSGVTSGIQAQLDGKQATLASTSITVSGTSSQVNVSGSPVSLGGTVTLSTPQNIATNSTPVFSRVRYSGNTAAAPGITLETDTDSGIYAPGTDQVGIASQGKQTARFVYRTLNGDDNTRWLFGTGAAVTNTTADTFIGTIDTGTVNSSGNSRAIFLNIGNNIVNATDTTQRTGQQANIEFDKTVFSQSGGAVTYDKIVNSRFRFGYPTTSVTVTENVGIDFVVPNASDVTGTQGRYTCINIPVLTGGNGTDFTGIRFQSSPTGGSISSATGTNISIMSGANVGINTTNPTSTLTIVGTIGGTFVTPIANGGTALSSAGSFAGRLLSTGTAFTSVLPRDFVILHDEMMNVVSGGGSLGFSSAAANGATVGSATPTAGHPGVTQLRTSTSTNGVVVWRTAADSIILGGGRTLIDTVVRVPNASDGTDTFTVTSGLFDTSPGNQVDGVYFTYSSAADFYTNVTKWSGMCASNSVRTEVSSSVFTANTFVRLTIDIDAGATLATFYIDGTSIGTAVPPGAGRFMFAGSKIEKTVGTTSRNFDIDTFTYAFQPTTPR